MSYATKGERVSTYFVHKLPDDSVPLSSVWIIDTVLAVGHKLYSILEPDHAGYFAQQVDAEAFVLRSASVFRLSHHYVGSFL